EASFLAFTDGQTVLPLPTSQDHKAIFDGDKGPNTGGMGAYSPAPVVTEALHRQVMETVMLPTVKALAAEGCPYKGVLYAGLMIDKGVVKVLEFNCRFGDPEAQPLLMRLKTDLVEVMEAVVDGRLSEVSLEIDPRPTVCVVMAAGGYPGKYENGKVIKGLAKAGEHKDVVVFHAGTELKGDTVLTKGGRVLGVTAIGDTVQEAIVKAYSAAEEISWDGCYYRKDIGRKALDRK
ncbi:MAG: phosphoribosylamine--glycine ligase, partial [Proteobacteria bacterium]|nr:phosphoribosylamine--glycine ligase [Pseudomonadota bacterium]